MFEYILFAHLAVFKYPFVIMFEYLLFAHLSVFQYPIVCGIWKTYCWNICWLMTVMNALLCVHLSYCVWYLKDLLFPAVSWV